MTGSLTDTKLAIHPHFTNIKSTLKGSSAKDKLIIQI